MALGICDLSATSALGDTRRTRRPGVQLVFQFILEVLSEVEEANHVFIVKRNCFVHRGIFTLELGMSFASSLATVWRIIIWI